MRLSDLETVNYSVIWAGIIALLVFAPIAVVDSGVAEYGFAFSTLLHVFTYVGAGVGIYSMNGKGEAIDDTFIDDLLDSAAAGVAVMVGLEYEATPNFRLYSEGRYTLQSDIRYPALRIGAALMRRAG